MSPSRQIACHDTSYLHVLHTRHINVVALALALTLCINSHELQTHSAPHCIELTCAVVFGQPLNGCMPASVGAGVEVGSVDVSDGMIVVGEGAGESGRVQLSKSSADAAEVPDGEIKTVILS